MKMINNTERLSILNDLSDQLWDDYKNKVISRQEYASKINKIREQISNVVNESFADLQNLASAVGYILVKKPDNAGHISKYQFYKN